MIDLAIVMIMVMYVGKKGMRTPQGGANVSSSSPNVSLLFSNNKPTHSCLFVLIIAFISPVWRKKVVNCELDTKSRTMAQGLPPMFPNAGKIVRGKVNMTLSMLPQPTRMVLSDNNGITKLSTVGGKEAELISLATGRCDQNPQKVTVAVIWEAEGYETLRSSEDMFLIPGIASIKDKAGKMGMDILFLILEVRKGVDKVKVMDTIKEGEGLQWLEMMDDYLVKDVRNGGRRLFRMLSGSMEMMVTELSGRAAIGGLFQLAQTVSTQFNTIDNAMACNIHREYSVESVRALSVIDPGVQLLVIVLSMQSDKMSCLKNLMWEQIGNLGGYSVTWPEMHRNRK